MVGTDPPDAKREAQRGSDWRLRLSRRRIGLGLLAVVALAGSTCTAYQAATWPDVRGLRERRPETTAFIERFRQRQAAAEQSTAPDWRWVPYDSIAPDLKRAVVAAEDLEFFSHRGFSYSEIKEAIGDALSGERELRGASTITQQLAKNLWLSPSRNPLRKVKEALLTRQLEKHLSKRRILDLYLNVVEFGPGIYGAEAAARRYFDKSAAQLSEQEAAQLAAALPRPSRWHPGSESPSYQKYVAEIRRRMDKAEFLWRRI